MNIGPLKRVIEVEPVSLPVPERLPEPEALPVTEPAEPAPRTEPSEPEPVAPGPSERAG